MAYSEILETYRQLQNNSTSENFSTPPAIKSQSAHPQKTRPNSFSIEDAFFGDSGKGAVVAKLNHILVKEFGKAYSIRYNGGANAGHETYINGNPIVTNQLPMGVIEENTVAVMSRGMVVHPEDLVAEIKKTQDCFGGILPGTLIIDERVPLVLDTHRAKEKAVNAVTTGGQGSTGRGIAEGYISVYGRYPVTLKDLLSSDWKEILTDHYLFYKAQVAGFKIDLAELHVYSMNSKDRKRLVGGEKQFIERLQSCREYLKEYASSETPSLLKSIWANSKLPVTLEGAQGAGLDPYHGVYPDVTASRPMSHHIGDATYNIILPEELFLRLAVMKTTYTSSVGKRVLPTIKDEVWEKWIQEEFHETGRTTGRLRDIYPVSLPIATALKRAAGYDALVATHLDASSSNTPIKVITHYTNKESGHEEDYFPYQDALDKLKAHAVEFTGWDGEQIKNAQSWQDLPLEAKKYLSFLSETVAPVVMATTGPDLDEYISFLPNL